MEEGGKGYRNRLMMKEGLGEGEQKGKKRKEGKKKRGE
jgi:hypothetical protein